MLRTGFSTPMGSKIDQGILECLMMLFARWGSRGICELKQILGKDTLGGTRVAQSCS